MRAKLNFAIDQQPPPPEGQPPAEWIRPMQASKQAIRDISQRINDTPWVLSVLCDPVTFTALGTKVITHTLGRVPVRWMAEDVTGDYGAFYRVAWDDKTITLKSTFACTALFRVE